MEQAPGAPDGSGIADSGWAADFEKADEGEVDGEVEEGEGPAADKRIRQQSVGDGELSI